MECYEQILALNVINDGVFLVFYDSKQIIFYIVIL